MGGVPVLPMAPGISPNMVKAAGRAIAGAPGYLVDLAKTAKHSQETGNVQELVEMLDPGQIPVGLKKQWDADIATGNKKLAVDNLVGGLAGLGVVAAVTHGATKAVGSIPEHVTALREKFTPVTEPPIRERTNVLHANTAGSVRQAKGQAPSIWLNPDAWESLFKVMYPDENHLNNNGFSISKPVLEAAANHPEFANSHPEIQKLLAEASKVSENSGAALASKTGKGVQHAVNVMREELNHTWQRQLAASGNFDEVLKPGIFSHLRRQIPQGMYDHLLDNDYDGYNSPQMVTEAAAKLLGGNHEKYNVSPEEATAFLKSYLDEIVAEHGTKAIDTLKHTRGVGNAAKEATLADHKGKENGRTNDGLANGPTGRGGLQGLSSRGRRALEFNEGPQPSGQGGVNDDQLGIAGGRGVPGVEGGGQGSVATPAEVVENSGQATVNPSATGELAPNAVQPGSSVPTAIPGGTGTPEDTLFNRDKDKPTWYLKSERLIGDKMKGPAPAEDVHKMLLSGGVKPEEMQWTGLADFLKSKGKEKVTPEEIREHLANNNIQIKEVVKGDQGRLDKLDAEIRSLADWPRASVAKNPEDQPRLDELNKQWVEAYKEQSKSTKFESYVLPDGESYREMLLTMPNRPSAIQAARIAELEGRISKLKDEHRDALIKATDAESYDKDLFSVEEEASRNLRNARTQLRMVRQKVTKNEFKSSHWDEPNVLAHVRFNDRTGPNGEKFLHLEEVQSDWHQKGRDKGYVDELSEKRRAELRKEANDLDDQRNAPVTDEELANYFTPGKIIKGYGGYDKVIKFRPADLNAGYPHDTWSVDVQRVDKDGNPMRFEGVRNHSTQPEMENLRPEIFQRIRDIGDQLRTTNKVPDAPFKKTWHEMALRRMLQHAATNGYDGVSWTGGEDQAARYDLSKQVSRISYMPNGDGTFYVMATPTEGGSTVIIGDKVTADKLADSVGKELATKIVDGEGKTSSDPTRPNMKHLEGLDLKVGGQGMKGFYNKIVPDYLNKFGKRFGAKVGEIALGRNNTPHTLKEFFMMSLRTDEDHATREQMRDADAILNGETDRLGNKVVSKTVQYLPVTPEMRKSVAEEGVPLFNREQEKTPEFKNWFSGSKVVDKDGEPMVLYHATPKDFDSFDPTKGELGNHFGTSDQSNSAARNNFTGVRSVPVYLSVKNPLRLYDLGDFYPSSVAHQLVEKGILPEKVGDDIIFGNIPREKMGDIVREAIKSHGYDGVVYLNRREGLPEEAQDDNLDDLPEEDFKKAFPEATDSWITLDPKQVKSAIGNSGAFDPKDPSILRNREKPEDDKEGDTPSAAGQKSDLDSNTEHEGSAETAAPEESGKEPVVGSTGTAPTTVIPIQGGTQLAAAPKQETVLPVAAKPVAKVLPLSQIKILAAGLNHNPQRQIKSVRELMVEAGKINPTRMIP